MKTRQWRRYLGHGEAQFGQLHVSNQWDGDAVGQDQVAVDNVLDDAVGEAAAMWGLEQRSRGVRYGKKQNGTMNY